MSETPKDTASPGELDARRQASEYLKRFPGAEDMECPVCHNRDWGVSDVAMVNVRPNLTTATWGVESSYRAYPLVPIGCATCGYTYFINEKWVRFGGPPPDLEIEKGIDP